MTRRASQDPTLLNHDAWINHASPEHTTPMRMPTSYIGRDGATYAVVSVHGESGTLYCVQREYGPESTDWETVASYRERWRAENHAIAGCGCQQNWHYYHRSCEIVR